MEPKAIVTGSTASSTLTAAEAGKIVNQAVTDGSSHVIIAPVISGAVTKTEVTIPANAVERLGNETKTDLTVTTPVSSVTIPHVGLSGISGGDVTISSERTGSTVKLRIMTGGKTVTNMDGGVTVTVPEPDAAPGTVAILVREDGTREVIRKSVADGTNVTIPLSGSASVVIVDNAKTFADVSSNYWAADAIAFASGHELFNGTAPDTFSPEQPVTRGMLAKVLHNLEGNPDRAYNNSFTDVGSSDWYTEAVAWTVERGVVDGYGDGRFGPGDDITREQLAVMLYRYAGNQTSPNLALNFSDADKVSGYAVNAMRWAVDQGIINGVGDGKLSPQGKATRAQVAAMLMRYCKAVLKSSDHA